jgi:hypothetical protein
MWSIYAEAGGPSFSFEEFDPENNESASITELLEEKAMVVVDQAITHTCAFPVGHEPVLEMATMAPTPAVTPGSHIPVKPEIAALFTAKGYQEISYFDRGVQGNVYRAVSGRDSMVVAIKHTVFDRPEYHRNCQREIAAVKAVHHPDCLLHVSSTIDDREAVLVTRFEPNGTLASALNLQEINQMKEDWPTKKSIIAYGIAFGMEHIHKMGLAHRDLKPGNIFLNEKMEPVIGDFGLSTDFGQSPEEGEHQTGPSMMVGTPLHMAPEVWVDESEGYDQSVDVYAYGMLLHSWFPNDDDG